MAYTLQVKYGVEGGQSKGPGEVSVLGESKMYNVLLQKLWQGGRQVECRKEVRVTRLRDCRKRPK